MKKVNYEILSKEENEKVSVKLSHFQKLVTRGVITIKEADFCFQEWAMKEFNEKAFTICTNKPDFKKESWNK